MYIPNSPEQINSAPNNVRTIANAAASMAANLDLANAAVEQAEITPNTMIEIPTGLNFNSIPESTLVYWQKEIILKALQTKLATVSDGKSISLGNLVDSVIEILNRETTIGDRRFVFPFIIELFTKNEQITKMANDMVKLDFNSRKLS